jgi:hypothetical protein
MATTWEDTLRGWVKPPSDNEDAKRDKTQNEIKKALSASSRLKNVQYKVYAKGSYANNTNVRLDYDVDIAVECTEFCYHELSSAATNKKDAIDAKFSPYGKDYGVVAFKADIEAALVDSYGRTAITRGNMALRVREKKTRLPADVVPCCGFQLVTDIDGRGNLTMLRGTRIRPDKGGDVNNWPQQQLENGIAKNNATNHRYKFMVRALKQLENLLVTEGKLAEELPSFLIECLVYNVPNDCFNHNTYVSDMQDVLRIIFNSTLKKEDCQEWVEVNERKYLFHSSQPWTYQQAHDLGDKAWDRMGFA